MMRHRMELTRMTMSERVIAAKINALRVQQKYHRARYLYLDMMISVLRNRLVDSFKVRGKDYEMFAEHQRLRDVRRREKLR